MKILQLGKFFPPDEGGVETASRQMAEGLAGRGHVCDVLCFARRGPYDDAGLPYRVMRTRAPAVVASTPLSWEYVRRLRAVASEYDVIHAHMPNPMAAAALFATRPDVPVTLHWHSDVIRQKRLLALYRPLERWLIRRSRLVIGPTDVHTAASDSRELFRGKSLTVPFCVDASFPAPEDADRDRLAALRARFAGKTVVFSLGRLIYYKGFSVLVEAAASLPDDFVVLIGGTGPLRASLDEDIRRSGLADKVVLLGRVPREDLAAYYALCDVFCLPSTHRSEMFGIVMLEAMRFGRPVVSTDIARSGVTRVNEHGVTGLRVPPNDPSALAGALLRVGTDKALHAELSGNCLAAVAGRFAEEPVMDALIRGFQSIL